MEVRVHSRRAAVDDGFRLLAEDKLSRLDRIFDGTDRVDLEVVEERNPRRSDDRCRVELTARAAGRTIRIEAVASTAESALDEAVDRFGRRLRRLKERLIDRNRRSTVPEPGPDPASANIDADVDVVRVKQFVMKPMNLEEAILQMDMLGHDFFFFINADSDRHSVLYRRRDGRLGLIEAA